MSSLNSLWTCPQCGRSGRGERHTTMTGRVICTGCRHDNDALTMGMLAGNGVGGAIAFRGARRWIRKALGKPSA